MQELMNKKDLVGDLFNQLRLRRQRSMERRPEQFSKEALELEDTLGQMLMVLDQLDSLIGTQCMPRPTFLLQMRCETWQCRAIWISELVQLGMVTAYVLCMCCVKTPNIHPQ